MWNKREEEAWIEIQKWEEQLHHYEPSDFQLLYDKGLEASFSLLSEDIQRQFFSKMDTWLFHLHALVQNSQFQQDARERILSSARVFHEDVDSISDLHYLSIDKLTFIAEQQIAKHRLYSFSQGGLSGMGGTVLLGSDLPAMTVINLRMVQLIAMSYGFEVNTPFEMMLSLKVFHAGTLPKRLQKYSWEELMEDIRNNEDEYFYKGKEEMTNISWLEQPMKQILKVMAISALKKKKFQGLPLISMAIGAGSNYQITRRVSEFAHNFYKYRFLNGKKD
ncbi:EcsC family protein [Peribacillus acanthi]|uniref:EcsC family protein n=1 Tax=Peribacillus acanthi TaxID=2171554 RepID=UPI003B82E6AE